MPDSYDAALSYLYGRLNYERTAMPYSAAGLRLARMRRLLSRLGDPHQQYPIVHVAGTKGKGSTAAMIAAALRGAGLCTGLSCSPHLHQLEERFNVDGLQAHRDELVGLVGLLRPVVADLDQTDTHLRHRPLTFFEITTAMGLVHFARRKVDAVVLEVGLGGRLDSTNAIRPAVSVITSISLDHTRQLGSTLGAIAREKAGIIKHGCRVVSGVAEPEPRAVIEKVAEQRRASLRRIERDFHLVYTPPTLPLQAPAQGHVRVESWRRRWQTLPVPLLGGHQAVNAAVALASIDAFEEARPGIRVSQEAVEAGWSGLSFPARVEVVGRKPWLVVDGAHNVASAIALAETLRTHFPNCRRTLVFGTTREKDLPGQLSALLPLFERVVATQYLENPRAVAPDHVAQASRALGCNEVHVARSPREAIETAERLTPLEGLICISGSLFLAAESRACILRDRKG